MSRGVAFIRKSQGGDDDVSLSIQREEVPALADSLADEVITVDLGVHTGFSIHMKDADDDRIDAHPKVCQLLDDLRAGKYDHLVAYDDTRLARDQFYWEIKRAAIVGDTEIVFVKEAPDDRLTFRVQRAVESDIKRREIEKSQAALAAREKRGDDQGRPPFGLRYDDDGRQWIADRKTGEFATALEVIRLRERGESWRSVADRVSIPRSTVRSVYERRERYLNEAEVTVLE